MDTKDDLPFKVGELAEARSFETGYRGAWFRCKIREISERKGDIGFVSEYYDFPDEKLKWAKLYQAPPYYMGRTREKYRELMLRPCYPPFYNENQVPLASEISEVRVIVADTWKVGDLVDWWTCDCYWSGKIIQLLGDDEAKVELKQPPIGEGMVYDIRLKDIRPSLDWSLELGWTVPIQDDDNGRVCARIIKPMNQGQETEAGQGTDKPKSMEFQQQVQGSKISKDVRDTQETFSNRNCMDNFTRKGSVDTASETNSVEPTAEVSEEELHSGCSQEYRTAGAVSLNSMQADTLEAAIMDLEELVNKVKWIKKILVHGVSFSGPGKPEWEFVDPPAASSEPK